MDVSRSKSRNYAYEYDSVEEYDSDEEYDDDEINYLLMNIYLHCSLMIISI